jgi:hypothetical protein
MTLSAAPARPPAQDSLSRSLAMPAIVACFLLSFLAIAILTVRHVIPYDEGLILTGAMQVAAGHIPHRDFYAVYGPGQFYALAALFDVFGQTLLVERLYDAAVKAGIVCLVYVVSLRLMGRVFATIVAGFCLLLVSQIGYPVYPIWTCLFFSLLAVLPLFAIFEGHYSTLGLFSSGLCAGAVVLFRYDMGILAVLALSFALALYGFVNASGRLGGVVGRMAALLLPLWCGAALVIVPLLAAYLVNGVMSDFIFQIFRFPATHYIHTRSLPFPPIWRSGSSIVYFTPLTIVPYIALVVVEYRHADILKSAGSAGATKWIAFVIAVFAAGLYFKGFVRVSPTHMAPSIIFSLILLGFTARCVLIGRQLAIRPALAVLVLAPVVCAAAYGFYAIRMTRSVALENLSESARLARRSMQRTASPDSTGPCDPQTALDRAQCFIVTDAERQAVQFVMSNSTPGQPIFVANGTNDKTFENNNAFYFLAGRQPASKWSLFDVGLQSSEAFQDIIVEELEQKRPPIIAIDTEFDSVEEPNDSAKHSGVTILDDYIHQHYKEVARFDPYLILQR